jgi:hypothetical protein
MDEKKFNALSKSQQDMVIKLSEEAERQGVNPKFVIAIAEAETGGKFSHHSGDKVLTSPAGAKGIMQIMPATAGLYNKKYNVGIDPDDEDSNIRGGVYILKDLLTKYKSPRAAVALYNASPKAVSTFIKSYDTDRDKAILSLPEETRNYALRISNNFNLDDDNETGLIPAQGKEKTESSQPSGAQPPTVELDLEGKPIDTSQVDKDLNDKENEGKVVTGNTGNVGKGNESTEQTSGGTKAVLGALGAKTGLITSASIEAARQGIPLIPNAIRAARFLPPDPNSPTTRSSMQRYLNSQHEPNVHLSDLEREFNNFLKSQDPAAKTRRLRTTSEVQKALDAVKPTADQIIAKPRVEAVPGKSGVFRNTGEFTSKLIPGSPGIDLEKYALNPNTPVRNVVRNAGKSVADFTKGVAPSLGKVAIGGLGGLGAALSAIDYYDYLNDPEHPEHKKTDLRALTKGAAAFGGGLMMVPNPWTIGAGAVLSAPEMGLSAYDYYNSKYGK